MIISVENSLSLVLFNTELNDAKKNEIINGIYNLLSYQKNGQFFVRDTLVKRYNEAQQLKKQFSTNEIKYKYPELYKFCFINYNKLEEWINFASTTYLYDKKTNSFPTGLLFLVQEFLDSNNINYIIKDTRKKPELEKYYFEKKIKLPPLRYYQQESLNKLLNNPRGIIEAATGTGKTLIIKELIYKKGVKTLIVVPSTNILNIFDEQLTELFGKYKVGIITGEKKQFNKLITIATYQSLIKMDAKWFDDIDMLITDEFHHSGCDTIVKLNMTHFNNIYYRYGFTATNYRNDDSEMALKGVLSNILFSYDYTKAVEENFLCPVNFMIYDYNNINSENSNTFNEELEEALIKNKEYNKHISDLAIRLDKKQIATIIFVSRIEHGNILNQLIPNSIFMNGQSKSLKQRAINKQIIQDFNDHKFNILIGTNVIGEGVDTIPVRVGILASGNKAESDVVQKIGRLMRLHKSKKCATFVDFTNTNCKFLNRHFKQRLKIYKTYKTNIAYKPLIIR